jgi:hypothetical protein
MHGHHALTVAGAMRDQWADEKATGDIAALTLQRMCGGSSFPQFHYGATYLLFTFAIWHFGLSSNGECRSFTLPVNCVCVCVFRNALPINENLCTTVGPICDLGAMKFRHPATLLYYIHQYASVELSDFIVGLTWNFLLTDQWLLMMEHFKNSTCTLGYTPSVLNYKSLWFFWYIKFAMYVVVYCI